MLTTNHDAVNGPTQQLPCGHSIYGPERVREAVRIALSGVYGELPNRWTVAHAVLRPLDAAELEPILPDLIELKNRDRWENETYPLRVATLALWIAHEGPWDHPTRCGVAWSNLLCGMEQHHFTIRPGVEHLVLRPSPLFFDVDVPELAATIRRAFVDQRGHMRHWLLQQLDRKREAAEARRLNRLVLERRARRQHPSHWDAKTMKVSRSRV